jgi:hypothetical protein
MAQIFAKPIASETPAIPPPRLDADGRISIDLPCRKCGYNLRAMARLSNCPECNLAIDFSLRSNYLRFADPAWVNHIATGTRWLTGGLFLWIAQFLPVELF